MPVCVSCTAPAPYLYTAYRTKSNIRLGVCSRCGHFLDPLIEHPQLIILLDLILLKPRVYLHLLYNRGSLPLNANADVESTVRDGDANRRKVLFGDTVRLGGVMVAAESLLRLKPIMRNAQDVLVDNAMLREALQVLATAIADLGSQLVITTLLCLAVLRWHGWYPTSASSTTNVDGRKTHFLPIVIPLTVLYTSILPVLLQLFLSIWYDPQVASPRITSSGVISIPLSIMRHIPPSAAESIQATWTELVTTWSGIDKIWAGTRLLGGMSAGFGLRIVLPTRPWETMAIILSGWIAGTWVREGLLGG